MMKILPHNTSLFTLIKTDPELHEQFKSVGKFPSEAHSCLYGRPVIHDNARWSEDPR